MKTILFLLIPVLVDAALQNPCLEPEVGIITQYVVFTNAEGTNYYCAQCTQCAAYAQNCTRYKNAICKEPVAIADDFVLALSSYCVLNVGIGVYYFAWHHKSLLQQYS